MLIRFPFNSVISRNVNHSASLVWFRHHQVHHFQRVARSCNLHSSANSSQHLRSLVKPELVPERDQPAEKSDLPYEDPQEIQHVKDTVKLSWKEMAVPSPSESFKYYLKLSKIRLTTLVVLTTLAGYTMGCSSFDPGLAAVTLIGTGLTSASAASLNQFLEIPFDSQMLRTRNRPLVLQQLSSGRALTFSIISGTTGLTVLGTMVNPLTAALGAFNLVLYSFVYTPMKRANIANTWIGSIVGAIPPVMGYTAAANLIDLPSLFLGLILYSWQFPHFNALSWNIRHDYARAGYRMMSVTNEGLCTRTALRHSALVTFYCGLLTSPIIDMNNYYFLLGSLPLNSYLIYLSWKFKQSPEAQSSRKLFRYSLIHLPTLIIILLLTKKSKQPAKTSDAKLVNQSS